MMVLQSLQAVWPKDAPQVKVFLCGESRTKPSAWPFKGEAGSDEGQRILKKYRNYCIRTNMVCGSRIQYIYMDMDRGELPEPDGGVQMSLLD